MIQKLKMLLEEIKNSNPEITDFSYIFYSFRNKTLIEKDTQEKIYPASLIKIFIASEVLRQVEAGVFDLSDKIKINEINSNNEDILYKEQNPLFPIFIPEEKYSIKELLSGMLGFSSNIASNTLIDLVSRESIEKHTLQKYPFIIKTFRRKFVSRKKEDPQHQNNGIEEGCTQDYFLVWKLIQENNLISKFVSENIKNFCLQKTKQEKGLPFFEIEGKVYRKGGWMQSKLYNGNTAIWEHDSGIWEIKNDTIIYSIMTLTKNKDGSKISFENIKNLNSMN